jgi:hypothetical protein
MSARLVEFCEQLRSEGVGSGTAELLDAFAVLAQITWTEPQDFREALAATLAKSQEDRRIFELVFERYFFRAAEAAAIRESVREGNQTSGDLAELCEQIDLDELRRRIAAAMREGAEGTLRDLARLAIAAFGRQGQGSACARSRSATCPRTIPAAPASRATRCGASRRFCAASSSAARSSAPRSCRRRGP